MLTLQNSTARKIKRMTPSVNEPSLTTLYFEDGTKESFLKWFMESKKPEVGKFLVRDTEGFLHCVTTLA